MEKQALLSSRIISGILVSIQFICLLFLVVSIDFLELSLPGIVLFSTAFLLALWSVYVMRKSRWHIMPEPTKNAVLVTKGPYHWIRHPMYLSILIFISAVMSTSITVITLLVSLLLLVVLILKIDREERFLKQKFNDYDNYTRNSKKLIPFLY